MFGTWWFNIIISLILFVVYNLVIKKVLNKSINDGAIIALLEFLSGLFILLISLFFKWRFPTDIKVYALLFASCIFYALTDRSCSTARRGLEVSLYGIFAQITPIFTFVFGITFFKEPIIINKIIGLLLIVLGNIFVLYEKGKFCWNKYVLYCLLGNFFFAVGVSIDVGISAQFNLPFYISISLIVPSLLIVLFNRISIKDLIKELKYGDRKSILIISIIWGLMLYAKFRSYQLGNFSTVTAIFASLAILNVIAAYIFLNEKSNVWKKIIAAILVAIGVFFANT